MNASIQSSYYLAFVAGGIMLLVAIIRGAVAFINSRKTNMAELKLIITIAQEDLLGLKTKP